MNETKAKQKPHLLPIDDRARDDVLLEFRVEILALLRVQRPHVVIHRELHGHRHETHANRHSERPICYYCSTRKKDNFGFNAPVLRKTRKKSLLGRFPEETHRCRASTRSSVSKTKKLSAIKRDKHEEEQENRAESARQKRNQPSREIFASGAQISRAPCKTTVVLISKCLALPVVKGYERSSNETIALFSHH